MRGLSIVLAWVVSVAALGCDKAESVAKQQAERVASAAASNSEKLLDDASELANEQLAELGDKAVAYVDKQLAAALQGATDGSLEARLAAGSSSAGEVARMAKVLAGAVESDTVVLPVYRKVDGKREDVDAAIKDMPRTEVVDGVTVGFKQLSQNDMKGRTKQDAYLVLWRRDDHLVGFIYKKRTRIDVDKLAREIPKLVKLLRGGSGDAG